MDCLKQSILFLSFTVCFDFGHAFPMSKGIGDLPFEAVYFPNFATALISVGALIFIVYFVLGCVCCPNKNIKALSYQNGFPVSRLNENAFDNPTEITIFPPQSVIDLQPVSPTFPAFNDRVTFEPLPDILPKKFTSGPSAACSSRPAHFSALLKTKVSLHDWFDDPNSNFPREQLQYLQEIGCGWFGRIVEGEATQICDNENKTAVVVKILREEASPSEHLHFLHEVRPYRDLKHRNIIQLLGRCLESDPFLLIMEYSICDLKSFLLKPDTQESVFKDDLLLKMVSDVCSGMSYMHEKGFCHMDLAAHNCFVCSNQAVKIGDYGISFDRWKCDYYCLGDIALPIRWYSPEILLCSETTIETKEITKEANVWAFGVVLWEIANFGKLPYEDLSDEEVLQMVLIEKSVQLSLPTQEFPYKNEISLIMKECWKAKRYRPTMDKIESFILQFCTDKLSMKTKELSFEERWNSIHSRVTEISSYTGTDSSSMKFENDFSTRSDLHNCSSDNEILSSFDMSFDMLPKSEFSAQLSPSLNVLNGSIDELTENDAYINSTSLSYGKYDADTLSNISDKDNFQMEEDKEHFQPNSMILDQKSALRNLDLVASQPDSSKNLSLHQQHDSNAVDKGKEMLLNGVSDLSDVSESFYSKSSNLSEYLDPGVSERYDGMSSTSDLNGNCNFYSNSASNDELFCLNELVSKSEKTENNNPSHDIVDTCNNIYKNDFLPSKSVVNSEKNPVPDIIIHKTSSNSVLENDEDIHSENNINFSYGQTSPKVYRFVLKEDTDNKDIQLKHNEFSNGLDQEVKECVKNGNKHLPATSTPLRNSSCPLSTTECSKITGDSSKNETVYDYLADQKFFDNGEMSRVSLELDFASAQRFQSLKSDSQLSQQNRNTLNSSTFDHFVTALSALDYSPNDKSGNNDVFHNVSDVTLHDSNHLMYSDVRNNSDTLYVTIESAGDSEENQTFSDVISPPKDYVSATYKDYGDKGNEYLSCSRTSDTVSPPQGFQDGGLIPNNDSFSESKTSFDQDFSTSADCGSSENLEQFLEDDPAEHSKFSNARLLETSFPEVASKSFTYENCAEVAGNIRPMRNGSSSSSTKNDSVYSSEYDHLDQEYNTHDNQKALFQSYDHMVVEDLDTGEQTVINEAYSVCDDYDNSAESDEILKINTETDEAIIVDSSETLIGFVPSRSIELLQEFEIIPPLTPTYEVDEEKESSESANVDACNSASPSPGAGNHNSSPYASPDTNYAQQSYRNFSLQNQVIEEEITEEIMSPSLHSSSSYCSNEIFLEDEKMSQSSESVHQGEMYESSVMPSVEHVYVSDDGLKSDVSSAECSPVKRNRISNSHYPTTDLENNEILEDGEDVMHSYQPTQSVRWLSDDALDVYPGGRSPVIIEGREILAGDTMQTCELTVEDIASALSRLESKDHLHGLPSKFLTVSQSPSPYSSVESSPCRDTVYTPDFESDSEETGSGVSCSSTSGSFECIHNKFKNAADISKVADESDKSVSSREQSPTKVFSKTWDCHATPTKGVLVSPEKKINVMRKSVSFHEADPQIVFEYPPASDSSEEEYLSDDNQELQKEIDYMKYADWDLQACDAEGFDTNDIFEIEELDSEPYVRRPSYSSVGPLNRPMLYSFTAGFSDEEIDVAESVPSSCQAPSNSPEEKNVPPVSSSQFSQLISSQLNLLVTDNEDAVGESVTDSDMNAIQVTTVSNVSVQEPAVSSFDVEGIVTDEPQNQTENESRTVHIDNVMTDFDSEEIIIEEIEDDSEDEISKETFTSETLISSIFNQNPALVKDVLVSEVNISEISIKRDGPNDIDNSNSPCIINVPSKDLSDSIVELNICNASEQFSAVLNPCVKTVDICNDVVNGMNFEDADQNIQSSVEKDEKINEKVEIKDKPKILKNNICKNDNIKPSVLNSEVGSCVEIGSNLNTDFCPVQEVLNEVGNKSLNSLGNKNNCKLSNANICCGNAVAQTDVHTEETVESTKYNNGQCNDITFEEHCSKSSSLFLNNSSTKDEVFDLDFLVSYSGVDDNLKNEANKNVECLKILPGNNHIHEDEVVNQAIKVDLPDILLSTTLGNDIDVKKTEVQECDENKNNCPSSNKILHEETGRLRSSVNNEKADIKANINDFLLSVPQIVVTPASGSESGDEIDYLKGQPEENSYSDPPLLDNFSVTSGFSAQPFDDVFGTYGTEDTTDYIEAFNFEFENGNFYEDIVENYPLDLQASDMLCPDDRIHKRSSSLPLMTENVSDDDSLTMKSDSSLVYDMSKGTTRL